MPTTNVKILTPVVLRKADGTSIVDTDFEGFNFNANIIVYNSIRYIISGIDYNVTDKKYYITVMPAEQ